MSNTFTVSREELQRELDILIHRERMKTDLVYFAEHAIKLDNSNYSLSACHRYVFSRVQNLLNGGSRNLALLLPSGTGKSECISRIVPSWIMMSQSGVNLISASHNAEFAEGTNSKKVQTYVRHYMEDFGVEFAGEALAKWGLTNKNLYRAAGAGAGIIGERATHVIVDDPFGKIEDAMSPGYREKVYNWWKADLLSRCKPGAVKILMHQRLHIDDLMGRLLLEEGEDWDVVFLPARFTGRNWKGEEVAEDEIGRTQIGQSIWPEYYTPEHLDQVEKETTAYAFASMFQQSPVPAGGALFKPGRIKVVRPLDILPGDNRTRGFDLAATVGRGDYTASCHMQRDPDGGVTILDVSRMQGGPEAVVDHVRDKAREDGISYQNSVKQCLPQEPGAAGKFLVEHLERALAGYNVEFQTMSGSKETRATPFAAAVNNGRVRIAEGPWNASFLEELGNFPGGKFDDQVDAASTAYHFCAHQPLLAQPVRWSHNRFRMR